MSLCWQHIKFQEPYSEIEIDFQFSIQLNPFYEIKHWFGQFQIDHRNMLGELTQRFSDLDFSLHDQGKRLNGASAEICQFLLTSISSNDISFSFSMLMALLVCSEYSLLTIRLQFSYKTKSKIIWKSWACHYQDRKIKSEFKTLCIPVVSGSTSDNIL